MNFSISRKGYFWEIVGIMVLFGVPAAIGFLFNCDPYENRDTQIPGAVSQLLVVSPIFALLLGGGLYFVGVAHTFLTPMPWLRRITGILFRLICVGLPMLLLAGVAIGDS